MWQWFDCHTDICYANEKGDESLTHPLSLSILSTGRQRSKKEGKFAVFGTVVVLGTTSVEYGKSCLLKGGKTLCFTPL